MDQRQIQRIAERAGITVSQAEAAVALLREDYSIPFIARWRKDVTGNLNEHTLEHVRLLMRQEIALDNRRKSALEKLSQAGNHDSTLAEAIAACDDPLELDDLCITLRREKRRRPMSVSPKDFEPLADYLWEQECKPGPLDFFAEEFIRQPSIIGKVLSPEEAILRARHILAERLAEMPEVRKIARDKIAETAVLKVHATRYEGHQKERYASYAGLE
ncbi:MAG TPA: Tex-like N-terminal domain-containing protein, partial [Candidatus Hydrogenedentes bacterium]|nr:Tex-like N-terminal domain-containing protein [Candidatus Hydrogenedentota bacterium]